MVTIRVSRQAEPVKVSSAVGTGVQPKIAVGIAPSAYWILGDREGALSALDFKIFISIFIFFVVIHPHTVPTSESLTSLFFLNELP
jgi:hypothetical protein